MAKCTLGRVAERVWLTGPRRPESKLQKEKGVPRRSPFIAVSGVLITGSMMNLPQRHWQSRHPARASRPGSRDPRSHVARPLQRPLDGLRRWCWQSSQFSCLREHFGCSPVWSGDHKLCVRTRRGSLVRANRTRRDLRLLRIVLKVRRPGRWPENINTPRLTAATERTLSDRTSRSEATTSGTNPVRSPANDAAEVRSNRTKSCHRQPHKGVADHHTEKS